MDDFKRFRYDFFGEHLSEESIIDGNEDSESNKIPKNDHYINNQHPQSSGMSEAVTEDSLMEFITDYFQGNVTEDFSELHYLQSVKNDSKREDHCNKSPGQMNAFDYSSSSEMNTSIELFTSPETSVMQNESDHRNNSNMEIGDGVSHSDLSSPFPTEEQFQSSRRKSISYEIVFTNSKEKNGKVKIHIVPNIKSPPGKDKSQLSNVPLLQSKKLNLNEGEMLQQENMWLRQRVHDLERKLRCIEAESERVVGELSKIIERKNETISQLELQIAGIRITTTG